MQIHTFFTHTHTYPERIQADTVRMYVRSREHSRDTTHRFSIFKRRSSHSFFPTPQQPEGINKLFTPRTNQRHSVHYLARVCIGGGNKKGTCESPSSRGWEPIIPGFRHQHLDPDCWRMPLLRVRAIRWFVHKVHLTAPAHYLVCHRKAAPARVFRVGPRAASSGSPSLRRNSSLFRSTRHSIVKKCTQKIPSRD